MNVLSLLIIGSTWPEPEATAAGGRMLRLISFFLEQKYQITFSCTAGISELSLDLSSLGVNQHAITLNHHSFDTFLQELQPDIVLFDRFVIEEQFGWRVAEFAPKAIRILDTEDLHSLRKTRETALKNQLKWTPNYWQQAEITKREIASIYRADISLIISSYEMYLLQEHLHLDQSLLLHLPFMREEFSKTQLNAWPTFESRKDFMCIGNGKHAPNIDAIIWLKKEIWPLIRKALPKAIVHVYGPYLPQQIQEMHAPQEGFVIAGWAADKRAVFRKARINLAPLRFGAGLKGKLVDAMQEGTPSITTSIGAEGMHDDMKWCGAISDTAQAFATAAIAYYKDQNAWQKAQQNGIAILHSKHSKKEGFQALQSRLNSLKQQLDSHRTQNFIGSLLHYQTMNSTKYMSKWIAEKNK